MSFIIVLKEQESSPASSAFCTELPSFSNCLVALSTVGSAPWHVLPHLRRRLDGLAAVEPMGPAQIIEVAVGAAVAPAWGVAPLTKATPWHATTLSPRPFTTVGSLWPSPLSHFLQHTHAILRLLPLSLKRLGSKGHKRICCCESQASVAAEVLGLGSQDACVLPRSWLSPTAGKVATQGKEYASLSAGDKSIP